MKTPINYEEIYREQLNIVRADLSKLSSYSITHAEDKNYNQRKRLKLLIALYNHSTPSDYQIVRFLFEEEKTLRQSSLEIENGDEDTLYLAAYILSTYKKLENIGLFIETKLTDFDSAIGFDSEFLFTPGIQTVLNYITYSNHQLNNEVLKCYQDLNYNGNFSDKDIDSWLTDKRAYFAVFSFPIQNYKAFITEVGENYDL